ncbi:MAG TPA: hypothetical protein VND62_08700 [Acidimicrobiales bacterium]|nr:hypothetical protein [Acidimicrobiales bacterium]
MTDMMTVKDKTSTWKSGVVSGKEKTVNPVLGSQRQVGNKKTGEALGQKKEAKPSEVTSDQATSAFTKLAPVVDFIIPKAADSGSLTAAIKIPVKGAFVGIQIGATAARGNTGTVQLGVTANVIAGATIGIATATFKLGAYLQVKGRDAKEALTMVSWVLYRQLAESNAPREVEQAWFGDKKGTAEQWDALVRKTLFSKETGNWVEVGAQIGASAKAGIGPVTGEVGGKLRMGRRYDSDSIDRRKGAKSLTQQFTSKLGIDRGAQASLGDRMFTVIGSATFSVAIAKGSLQVTVAIRQVKDKQGKDSKGAPTEKTSYELQKITVTGTAQVTGMGLVAGALARGKAVQSLLSKVCTKSQSAGNKAKKELKSEKGREAGEVAEDITDYTGAMTVASQAVSSLSTLTTIFGLTVTGRIHISGGYTGGKTTLKVAFEKVTAITVNAGVFSLTAKKTERLASIEYTDGKWVAHLGELSKEIGKSKPKTGGGKSTSSSKPSSGTGKGTGSKGGTP